MTESELLMAYFEGMAATNSNFEFWITATFALIIAIQFVKDDISRGLKSIILALYLTTSVVLNIRYNNAGLLTNSVVDLLHEMNTEVAINPLLSGNIVGPLINLIWYFGTFAAIFYVYRLASPSKE